LENAAISLVEGGVLVYSTCSFSKEENEDNLDFLVEQGFESLQVDTVPSWGVVESISTRHQAYGYRFYPDKLKGEGFFCALFRKTSPDAGGFLTTLRLPSSLSPNLFSSWLVMREDWFFFEKEEDVYGCDAVNAQDLFLLRAHLRIRKSGLRLGRLIRGELVPDHELALSDALSQGLPAVVLEKPDAIRFLRRDDLPVETAGNGWHIVQYDGVSLGWAKLVQGKVKNNYPMVWRILMKP
jgi:NOL1/NOP2/fmu family ribosome biogenesis protein